MSTFKQEYHRDGVGTREIPILAEHDRNLDYRASENPTRSAQKIHCKFCEKPFMNIIEVNFYTHIVNIGNTQPCRSEFNSSAILYC